MPRSIKANMGAVFVGTGLTIAVGLAAWALSTTVAHAERVSRMEAQVDAQQSAVQEIHTDVREIRSDVKRLLERK